jgi:hypothetical protein
MNAFRVLSLSLAVFLGIQFTATAQEVERSYDYERMWYYSRELLTRQPVKEFLREVFAEALEISEEDANKLGFEAKDLRNLSEPQFILLLRENPEFFPELDAYLKVAKKFDRKEDKALEQLAKKWGPTFRKQIKKSKIIDQYLKLKYPLEKDATDAEEVEVVITEKEEALLDRLNFGKIWRKFLKHVFAEALQEMSAEDIEKYEIDLKKPRTLDRKDFVLLLRGNPEFFALIQKYLADLEAVGAELKSASKEISEKWRPKFRALIEKNEMLKELLQLNDPLNEFLIDTKTGGPSLSGLTLDFSHDYEFEGKVVKASDLRKIWIKFINAAKKEIVLNVFDFDLMEVADALIAQSKKGLHVRVGIDDKVIDHRPEVKAVYNKLKKGGVKVFAVDSPGLNHQKMSARDWSLGKDAAVLLSSGNLTKSGIHPDGDLAGSDEIPEVSKPNANHTLVFQSELIAQLINHELTKTLDMGLRGRSEYPLSGAYKFMGRKISGVDFIPSLTMAFTPSGGLNNMNEMVNARLIRYAPGPISIAMFALSSEIYADALFERFKADKEAGIKTELIMVGDKPFALMDWSVFLEISGLEVVRGVDADGNKTKTYIEKVDNRWRDLLGEKEYKELLTNILVAGKLYGMHHITSGVTGESLEASVKLHHKLTVVGDFATAGSSLNGSKNALGNVEQMGILHFPRIAKIFHAAIASLAKDSRNSRPKTRGSVHAEAMERVRRGLLFSRGNPHEKASSKKNSRLSKCYKALAKTGRQKSDD